MRRRLRHDQMSERMKLGIQKVQQACDEAGIPRDNVQITIDQTGCYTIDWQDLDSED